MVRILFITTLDLQIHTFHERIIHSLVSEGNLVDAATNGFYTDNNQVNGTYTNPDLHEKYVVPFSRNPLNSSNFKAEHMIRQLILDNHYDIVSCHSPSAGFYGRRAARGLDVKVIYTAHGFHFFKGAPFINNTAYKAMEQIAAHWTDVLMTINPEDYHAAEKFHYKKGGGPVYIPGIGVDVHGIQKLKTDKAEIRKELGLPEDAFILYSIGELIPRKNHRFVLESLKEDFHHHPDLHYVISGFGKLMPELNEYIRENGLEKQVHLLGFRTDARRLMYGMDLFVFPSLQEGLPVAVMEAMAAGLPCVVSDIRGSHDLIHDHENGLVYPSGDSASFRSCVKELKENEAERKAFALRAGQDAEQYSIEQIDPQILALYRK